MPASQLSQEQLSQEQLSQQHLAQQRRALTAIFTVHGFLYASWAVRVPAIKQQTGASAAALGLALLALSGGAVLMMLLTDRLCRRFGSRQVTFPACAVLSVTLLLPPLAHSAVTLGLALLVFGAAYGCLNVAMNSVAVELVAALDRPVMPSFHAAWSIGGLLGASLGGLLASHLSPLPHLALAGAVGIVTVLGALAVSSGSLASGAPKGDAFPPRSSVAPQSRHHRAPSARSLGPQLRVVAVLGVIALCAACNEGAIGDWAALHLKQDLNASAALAAAGYAMFALAEAAGRLSGTALLERYGRTAVLVTGGLTACGGMLLAALAPQLWLALAGFAATGLGLANLFPVAMARAGLLAGSTGVALAATLGYGGFLIGPPVIGFLAARFGLRSALATLAILGFTAAVIAYASKNSRATEQ